MVSGDICGDMDRKPKKEQKTRKKWMKFWSSSKDVMVSATTSGEDAKSSSSSSSSSRKRKCPSLRRGFRRMLSVLLPCMSMPEVDESNTTETQTTNIDAHTDASSPPALSGSSDPELDLQAKTQVKEALRDVPGEPNTSTSSDGSSSSADSGPSDQETSGGLTSSSTVGDSFSEESEKIDLLTELQAAAVLEDAAGDQTISDVDLDCILCVLASKTVQSNGLSQTEILQLIQCGSQQQQIETKQQSSGSDTEDDADLVDVVPTASPTNIKHLGFPNLGNTCYMNSVLQCLLTVSPFRDDVLSQRERWKEESAMLRALTDLHMTRLTGNDKKLKVNLLSAVKRCIETHHPDFLGDHQQDAHEFLMVCLSHLKEEGEFLQRDWPEYTCPVTNMEFRLKRLRTCDSCGFQRSFSEDCNYLSLVISPRGCLVDSMQQYFNTSSSDCSCSECVGTTASEALELITFPRVLVLLVMRFDIACSMGKLKNRLEVPEEFSLSYSSASREMTVIDKKQQQKRKKKKKRAEPAESQDRYGQEVDSSDGSSTQYTLAGVVSHLGSSLYCGHYISHIRDFSGSGWLECSDTSIRKSSWSNSSHIIQKNGYMLFYVKS